MNHSKHVLFLAVTLSIIGATSASPLQAANSDWNNLKVLKAGQKIRIVRNGDKRYEGLFRALNDVGITLRQSAGEQTFARKDILRVYCKGDNERIADMVLGAIVERPSQLHSCFPTGVTVGGTRLLGYGRCLWGLALALGPRFLLRGGAKSITPADTEGPRTVAAEPVCRDNSSGNGIKYLNTFVHA